MDVICQQLKISFSWIAWIRTKMCWHRCFLCLPLGELGNFCRLCWPKFGASNRRRKSIHSDWRVGCLRWAKIIMKPLNIGNMLMNTCRGSFSSPRELYGKYDEICVSQHSHISSPWCWYTFKTRWFWTFGQILVTIPAPWWANMGFNVSIHDRQWHEKATRRQAMARETEGWMVGFNWSVMVDNTSYWLMMVNNAWECLIMLNSGMSFPLKNMEHDPVQFGCQWISCWIPNRWSCPTWTVQGRSCDIVVQVNVLATGWNMDDMDIEWCCIIIIYIYI